MWQEFLRNMHIVFIYNYLTSVEIVTFLWLEENVGPS